MTCIGGWVARRKEKYITYRPTASEIVDTQNHTTTYTYLDNGAIDTITDYLDRVTTYDYDEFGRVDTITNPDDKEISYTYNLNSQPTAITREGQGTTEFSYDNAGRVSEIDDPIRGAIEYSYNVRGNVTEDEKGTYSYDILGRKTGASYTGGGSDSWAFNLDGFLSNHNEDVYTYDKKGNKITTLNEAGTATYTYSQSGSSALGLPNSITGSGGGSLSSYSFTYTSRYWLDTIQDTSKSGNPIFDYSWSSNKEMTGIGYPNNVTLSQTWSSKKLDSINVSYQQESYLTTDTTYNTNDQLTQYLFSVDESSQNTFSETYDLTYDTLGRLEGMDYDSGRTIDYSYDSGNGKLSSIDFSDLGEYTINYDGTGNISFIAYPNNTGIETYSYSGGLGRISSITYPGNKDLEFTWNSQNQITRLEYTDNNQQTNVIYALSYNHAGKIAGYTKSEDSIQTAVWNFYYGPFGLEKAYRSTSPTITEDFTTAPDGRILSMTYTQTGGEYNGEYYFHYDNFGNTVLLTNASGEAKYSAMHDLHSGKLIEEWNPNGLELVNQMKGLNGSISLNFPNGNNIVFYQSCSSSVNILCSFGNIGVGGGLVKPLDFKLPERMATCGESCTKENTIKGKTLSSYYIEIKVTDIDMNGHFSEEHKKELKKGGLTDIQIENLGHEAEHCKNQHRGGKLQCFSERDPRGDGKGGQSDNCCLTCECRTSSGDGTGAGKTTMCGDGYWVAYP